MAGSHPKGTRDNCCLAASLHRLGIAVEFRKLSTVKSPLARHMKNYSMLKEGIQLLVIGAISSRCHPYLAASSKLRSMECGRTSLKPQRGTLLYVNLL